MKIIGITGGVGAGKSTVLDYLREQFQAYVIQADQVGHQVMEPGEICYSQVIALFGEHILKKDKTIDRKAVSDVVFGNEEKLKKLNGIIHPAVRQSVLEEIQLQKEKKTAIVVVEAALLLEEHYEKFCDKVWYVHTDREIRISRLMENRGYSREKSESIISSQAPDEYFAKHADYIIRNNGDIKDTWLQVEEGIRLL
nr:dephospho-CoA kinase [uncultured Blautia sp.]